MLCFFSAPRYLIQVTESLIFENLEIIRFCAKLRVHKRFRIQFILLQYYLFYTVQAASSKITQISIDNHLEYDCEKVLKLRSKVKNVLKKSVLASSVLHNIACNYKLWKI